MALPSVVDPHCIPVQGFDATPHAADPADMATQQETITQQAQVGRIKFYASACPHQGSRRVQVQETVGGEGGETADFGSDARSYQLAGVLTVPEYLDLVALMDEAQVLDVVHPLFGVLRARITAVQGDPPPDKEGVDASITVVESGPRAVQLAPTVVTLPAAAAQSRALWADLEDSMEALGELDLGDAWDAVAVGLVTAWAAWELVLDAVDVGAQVYGEASAAYGGLMDAVGTAVDMVDNLVVETVDLLESTVVDELYSLADSARAVVDRVGLGMGDVVQQVQAVGDMPLVDLVGSFLDTATEEELDAWADLNPGLVDLLVAPEGITLAVPV